ncbi:molybdopterin synthase catalytic subunit MoaE [Spirabiliibacterium falconis]|uniref:molybdopterin synthase catalytic subunit MoaE n=1 Tax=Spirabiliibacterium falconis TaxID=572023 RepID=UPI001AAD191F|nr:molybdopterin synthase catalytic subunit MoaE [Spirabiliibacterium falconis]MBE2894230.1 molybdopterin synthase catalytic subunit MoaE [Spirabiliibacterium falconis]
MSNIHIAVQHEAFDQSAVYQWLAELPQSGAVVMFIGKVRDMNLGDEVQTLTLEHYPGMTEKALHNIIEQACARWALDRVSVIHRIGTLSMGDEIVLVGVSSAHRGSAYQANEFIMDYLKTQAPFWKKEKTSQGDRWIEARDSDQHSADRWQG